ncbi:MAG: TonB-dependent receptor [Pseudomonadota bacterium]|nr:TonB-dependent receptor [Pseudomonadota bacterium]
MSANRLVRASVAAIIGTTVSFASSAAAPDVEEELEEVVVTGSRVITDNVRSPTPIAALDVAEAALTTPSDIADALNKLPQIVAGGANGGRTPRSQGNGSTNNGGNTLSLRNFGASRTLVLLDGHRIAPSNQDGTVAVDNLPQMLVERVDIVTGGASAVYGSDAVAGVVNYVLDKNFTGFKFQADAGMSKYGDGEQGQVGFAWGTSLFDGRGHFETSARYREQARIPISARPYGEDGQAWLLTGNGSAANPYTYTPYARRIHEAMHGTVNCGTACTVNNYTFNSPGALSPLVHGVPTGSANIESGGDGAWIPYGTFRSGISMKDWFGRFSYDVSDDVSAYVQASWAMSTNLSDWVNVVVSSSPNRPNTLFADNPFLTAESQQLLGAGVTCDPVTGAAGWRCLPGTPPSAGQNSTTPPAPPTTPYFSVPSYIWNNVGGQGAGPQNRMYRTDARNRARNIEFGMDGSLGNFSWNAFYNFGESVNKVINPNNTDNARYLASLDAVIAPPGTVLNGVNVGGTPVCWVSLQPQFAGLYPGCVPTNIVDPNGPSVASFNYLRSTTFWALEQDQHTVGASIGGGLFGVGLPAGEIQANLSVDARWATYDMISNALPTEFVDCTGLRMCLANASPTPQGPSAPVRWVQNTNAPVSAKNDVVEAALEINVPMVRDLPFVQDLSSNWAARYTKYSSFSAVETWKGGVNWIVNDSVRLRGTYSRDIRAPNLNDLFEPLNISSTSFTDTLTGQSGNTRLVGRGNPDLTPEKARTVTAGVVLTPSFLPELNFSVDYFKTKMKDAITRVRYDQFQSLCTDSAPAYDSPICALAIRPITDPSDPGYTLPANYPTEILNAGVNAARLETHGFDFQLNYGFDLNSLVASWGGRLSFRHMATYQPPVETVNLPGAALAWSRAPKQRHTTFLTYQNQDWTVALQNQWLGKVRLATSAVTNASQNYVQPTLPSFNVVDATLSKKLGRDGGSATEVFLTVNNLLNERAPLFPSDSGLPNLFYPTLGIHDDMGRFFTLGVRVGF